MHAQLEALIKALQRYEPQRIIIKETTEPFVQRLATVAELCPAGVHVEHDPEALAPPAVPFESYTQEQGAQAVGMAQAMLALVRQKFSCY